MPFHLIVWLDILTANKNYTNKKKIMHKDAYVCCSLNFSWITIYKLIG